MGPYPDLDDPTPGMHIFGWMLPVELNWLMTTASRMESVVEVGSLHGRSAFALLTACSGTVYCVDSWSDEADLSFGSFMGSCGHFENLVPLRAFSPGAAEWVPGMVDMVFLDGSHVYESVLADIAAWLPKTRKIICGHDYQQEHGGFPDVERVVTEVFGDRVQVGEGTSIWWVDVEADRSVASGLLSGVLEYRDEYGRDMKVEVAW